MMVRACRIWKEDNRDGEYGEKGKNRCRGRVNVGGKWERGSEQCVN